MSYKNIITEEQDNILILTINRPDKLNALNFETLQEIEQVFDSITSTSSLRGVIITGAGEKAFIAGADINEFTQLNAETAADMARQGQRVFAKIENCPRVVIAAVNGYALGGGCELSLACHIRVAAENASFGQPEVNLGIIPGYGATQRLTQLIGKGRAIELMTTADIIPADIALKIGLVNHVVKQIDVMGKSMEILLKIATKAPIAIENVITAANAAQTHDGYKVEVDSFSKSVVTEDFKEGVAAFIEKRKAEFKGN